MADEQPNHTAPQDALTDEITVGQYPGTAGGTLGPETPGTAMNVAAVASRQYAAGSRLQWYQNMPKALPWALDDISGDFGDDVYDRMLLDAQVRSVVNVLKTAIIETGARFHPPVDDKTDPDFATASDLCDRVTGMMDNLTVSLDDVLWNMADAIALGNKMAEQVFMLDTSFSGKREYILQRLAVKPRESVAFVVDVYFNVLGILARVPGQPFGVQQGLLLAELQSTSNFLPRSKFCALTFRPQDEDPRGTSILRPAFDPWNAKLQIKREFLKYLAQFAAPSLIGFTAQQSQPYMAQNADGTLALDEFDNPIWRNPEDDMILALQSFANGTAAAFPFGADVKEIMNTGGGEAFLNAFQFYDRQIAKAILNQTLATEEGLHQTRASSGTHKDILDVIVRQAKRPVERMLERDVIHVWLKLNGLEHLLALAPKVTLGQAPQEDLTGLWNAVAQLQRSNYLHSSQYAELDAQLGLPERDPPDATTIPATEQIRVDEQGNPAEPDDTEETDEETAGSAPQNGQKPAENDPNTEREPATKPAKTAPQPRRKSATPARQDGGKDAPGAR